MRLREIQFVEHLRTLAAKSARAHGGGELKLNQGIGDDCAIFSAGRSHDFLVTTDLFVEEIHFRREWQPAHSVGHKVLTRGLSDIAAMGGTPRLAFLSVALPRRTTQRWINDFLEGFLALAAEHSVMLAGGDSGSSPGGFMADIVLIGEVPRGTAVMRSTARAGEDIWVSGKLGGAAAQLQQLRSTAQGRARHRKPGTSNPYFYPQARVEAGQALRSMKLASAMMDLSDGLSLDLLRLTKASGVGAMLEARAIPRAHDASLDGALDGGDDFELLFTVPAAKSKKVPRQIGGVPLTRIGEITRRQRVCIVSAGVERPLPPRGYQHF